jgi:hypothetical protein
MGRLLAGLVLGIVAFNFAMGFFVTPQRWVYPPLPISKDLPDNHFREYRQFTEGLSSARINDSGARFTAEFIPGAPVVVLMGDSHVLARYVSDGEPMGAVTAELARRAGQPLNVRQLGRSGGTPADFALASRDVLARWNPVRVFVVLSQRSFALPLLHSAEAAIDADGSVRAIPPHDSLVRRVYWRFRSSTPLAELLCNNPLAVFAMLWGHGAGDDGEGQAVSAAAEPSLEQPLRLALGTLRQRYGERLVIVYHPVIGLAGGLEPDRNERLLLDISKELGIPCFSVRAAMVRERDGRHLVSNGFINKLPGEGHLNATGQRIVGAAVWNYLATAF